MALGRKGERTKQGEDGDNMNRVLDEQSELSASLSRNIDLIDSLFCDVDTTVCRQFENQQDAGVRLCIYYSDGVTSAAVINDHILKPLLLSNTLAPGDDLFARVKNTVQVNQVTETDTIAEIVAAITYGDTLILVDGCAKALLANSKSFALRSLSEPDAEKVVAGPREGFTEGLMQNLSMLRRRLRTNQLKLRMRTLGRQTQTSLCVCYMDNIVNKKILQELFRRLDKIDMDGVLDSHYLTEHIAERSIFGFAIASTERPDIVAARLLEGRIAILVDGSPMALTAPCLFIENFQSNEDYYTDFQTSGFQRILRLLSFWLSISIPALYIAIGDFHHEMLPTALLLHIARERQSVPLPAGVECFVMLLVFDILKEGGVRMPAQAGHAFSIVGALVIGQAAVSAKLVAAPMIIVVASTGITSLPIPKLSSAVLFCRYFFLLLASTLGMMGLLVGQAILCIHLLNLNSFGVPALTPTGDLNAQDVKDLFARAAWPDMLTRIAPLSSNRTRARRADTK